MSYINRNYSMKKILSALYHKIWTLPIILVALLIGLPAQTCAQCGHVQVVSVSATGQKSKCGWTSVPLSSCPPSDPPQYYLTWTTVQSKFLKDNLVSTNGQAGSTENYNENLKEIITKNRYTCQSSPPVWSGSASYSNHPWPLIPGIVENTDYSGNIAPSGGSWSQTGADADSEGGTDLAGWENSDPATPSQFCSSTENSTTVNGSYNESYLAGYEHASWTDKTLQTLSDPYTDEDLRSDAINAISYPPNWNLDPSNWSKGSGQASYSLTDDHVTATVRKMKYCFHITDCQPHTDYFVIWDLVTTRPIPYPITVQHKWENIQGNGDPVKGTYGKIHNVDVPLTQCTITVENVQTTYSPWDLPGF